MMCLAGGGNWSSENVHTQTHYLYWPLLRTSADGLWSCGLACGRWRNRRTANRRTADRSWWLGSTRIPCTSAPCRPHRPRMRHSCGWRRSQSGCRDWTALCRLGTLKVKTEQFASLDSLCATTFNHQCLFVFLLNAPHLAKKKEEKKWLCLPYNDACLTLTDLCHLMLLPVAAKSATASKLICQKIFKMSF